MAVSLQCLEAPLRSYYLCFRQECFISWKCYIFVWRCLLLYSRSVLSRHRQDVKCDDLLYRPSENGHINISTAPAAPIPRTLSVDVRTKKEIRTTKRSHWLYQYEQSRQRTAISTGGNVINFSNNLWIYLYYVTRLCVKSLHFWSRIPTAKKNTRRLACDILHCFLASPGRENIYDFSEQGTSLLGHVFALC